MWFARGYVSRHFVTDEATLSAELRNPLILIYGKKISDPGGLMPYLDRAVENKRPLLIIAEDVENEALTTLVVNRREGGLKVVAVKAPGFSAHRRDNLEDLAILTGAQVILGEPGLDLADATPDCMGRAQKVRITANKTTIIGGAGDADAIRARGEQLSLALQNPKTDHEERTLRRRLAKLTSTVAFIHVGGFSETEIKEKQPRIEKALRAARSAIDGGYVAGGGAALLHAAKSLDGLVGNDCDEYAGIQIVRRALAQPLGQIAANAGADSNAVIGQIAASADPRYGFDANSREFGDVVDSGVIDPTNVVCTALRGAASIAGPLLLAEAAVAVKPVKKIPRHPFACKCSDHDHHHYPGDPYHEHHLPHSHGHSH
jgi:chaperonin GroEL